MDKLTRLIKLLLYYLRGNKRQVIAGIIEKDGKILIAKRKGGSRLGGFWEFPGGKLEPGETHEQCLKREMKEEFDIEVNVGGHFSTNAFRYCGVGLELVVYKVKLISDLFKLAEHDEVKWVSASELEGYEFVEGDKPVVQKLING